LTPATKHQLKAWMRCSPQVLSLPTQQNRVSFSRMVKTPNYEKYKKSCDLSIISGFCDGQYIRRMY
jgi:hypothetical protein